MQGFMGGGPLQGTWRRCKKLGVLPFPSSYFENCLHETIFLRQCY